MSWLYSSRAASTAVVADNGLMEELHRKAGQQQGLSSLVPPTTPTVLLPEKCPLESMERKVDSSAQSVSVDAKGLLAVLQAR